MEKPSVAFDPLPNSLPLQGKRVLAAPRRVFGSRERERKGKKMGQKEKKHENWSPKIYSLEKVPPIVFGQGNFYSQPIIQITKIT